MKVVLSRKGFDSSAGGMPSPIFPDGSTFSLPIPVQRSQVCLGDLRHPHFNIATVAADLSNGRIHARTCVHLDPDLIAGTRAHRKPGWRGSLGQVHAAQQHLHNQRVGPGDLFLFYGWYRDVVFRDGRWRFQADSPDRHIVFGWLLVEECLSVHDQHDEFLRRYSWLDDHPHITDFDHRTNTLYIAADDLGNLGMNNIPGWGVFPHWHTSRVLTKPGQPLRSLWQLPGFFYPGRSRPPLTYHGNLERWSTFGTHSVTVRTAGRGQEFVIDSDYYPELEPWLYNLFN